MSKDPAFLFYSSDFLTGTITMTNEQVGQYIRLLCLQHQKGHLTEKDMLFICQSYDEDVFTKFTKDDEGKFFNQRLDDEVSKRIEYSKSRSENRRKGLAKGKTGNKQSKKGDSSTASYDNHMSNICETYDEHMENENENINEDINRTIKPKILKQKYGMNRNVLLTEDEYERLSEKYSNLDEIIEWFSNYIVEKSYKSKSHNLSIQRWVADAVTDKKGRFGVDKQTIQERIMNL